MAQPDEAAEPPTAYRSRAKLAAEQDDPERTVMWAAVAIADSLNEIVRELRAARRERGQRR